MEIGRREFLALAGASALTAGAAQMVIGPGGSIASLNFRGTELIPTHLRESFVKVTARGRTVVCDRSGSVRKDGRRTVVEYRFESPFEMTVRRTFDLEDLTGELTALRQTVRVEFARQPDSTFTLQVPIPMRLPAENRSVFVPMKNGIGRSKEVLGLENDDEYVFALAGAAPQCAQQQLAIPMLDEWAAGTDLHITHSADPFFGSHFQLPYGELAGRLRCTYRGGLTTEPNAVERTLYTVLHRGPFQRALEAFYATALAGVKPGPEWIHDVAMAGYDYMSENGKGWFTDIDALAEAVAPADRSKVLLALHGWYDLCGRYSFDYRNQRFDKKWLAFPAARDAAVQSLGVTEWEDAYRWPKKSVEAMQPVPMSPAELHRRILYAKTRGFRVALYFADGTNGCTGIREIYDPSKVLAWGGWQGPDTSGKVYSQNPLHPEVYKFYTSYIRALLEEYGKEVDGFIWDETHTVPSDALRPREAPGYAAVAMMKLVRDCAAAVAGYSPQLAFFASDNVGHGIGGSSRASRAPYCLAAHGTYQDSHVHPEAWFYGLFPNFRNTIWSCNWAPVTLARLSRYAVETFDAPVPISNGPFGDDTGFAELPAGPRRETMALFDQRKQRPMRISWIEEDRGEYRYQGRPIRYKYSL